MQEAEVRGESQTLSTLLCSESGEGERRAEERDSETGGQRNMLKRSRIECRITSSPVLLRSPPHPLSLDYSESQTVTVANVTVESYSATVTQYTVHTLHKYVDPQRLRLRHTTNTLSTGNTNTKSCYSVILTCDCLHTHLALSMDIHGMFDSASIVRTSPL